MAQTLQLDNAALRRKRKPRISLLLVINNLCEQNFRNRRQAPAGHLFRVTHQLVEVNLRRRNKRANSPPPLYDAFPLQRGQRVPRRHQTHLMNLRKVALRRHCVPRAQVPGLDPLSETALDSLVRWQPITSTLTFRTHSRSRNLQTAYNESVRSRSL